MTLALLSGMFLVGVALGVVFVMAVIEHYVKTDGNFEYKWGGRWYRVQGRNRR